MGAYGFLDKSKEPRWVGEKPEKIYLGGKVFQMKWW